MPNNITLDEAALRERESTRIALLASTRNLGVRGYLAADGVVLAQAREALRIAGLKQQWSPSETQSGVS